MASGVLVHSIDVNQLAIIVQSNLENIIIIDGRSFLDFNTSHITSAVNVCCSKIVKRRLQHAKLSVKDFLMKTCHLAVDENVNIIVYDQTSIMFSETATDSFINVLLTKLVQAFSKVTVLTGGFAEFQARYPTLCEDKARKCPPVSLSQPCLPINENGPTKILPFLYLGSQHDAMNSELLLDHNITYELNVSVACPKADSISDGHFLRISVNDNFNEKLTPHFERAFQFIDKVREVNGCVLIHCLAGISRSPTIAIAYIMKHFHWKSDEAYRYIKSKRATISPNFNFLGQLLEYEQLLQSRNILPQSQELDLAQPFHHTQFSTSTKTADREQKLQKNMSSKVTTCPTIPEYNCSKDNTVQQTQSENYFTSHNEQNLNVWPNFKNVSVFGNELSSQYPLQQKFEDVHGIPLSKLDNINFTPCHTYSNLNEMSSFYRLSTYLPLYNVNSHSSLGSKNRNFLLFDNLALQSDHTGPTSMSKKEFDLGTSTKTLEAQFTAPKQARMNEDEHNTSKNHAKVLLMGQVKTPSTTKKYCTSSTSCATSCRKDDRLYRANSCPGIVGFIQCQSADISQQTAEPSSTVHMRSVKFPDNRETRARNRHSCGGLECITDNDSIIFDSCPDFTTYQSKDPLSLSPIRRPFHRNPGIIKVA